MVLKNACNHCSIGEAVAARAHDLGVVPQAFELSAIRPMECAMALQLAVMELTFKPRAIWQHLLPFALDAN